MFKQSFNHEPLIDDKIYIKYDCVECHQTIELDNCIVPEPDADTGLNEFYNGYEEFETKCSNCNKKYSILIIVEEFDSFIKIEELPEYWEVDILDFKNSDFFVKSQIETFLYDTDAMKLFRNEIQKLKDLLQINIDKIPLYKTFLRHIYAGTITCMEDYLSTILIQEVLSKDHSFRKFIETDPSFQKQSFSLSSIYFKLDGLKNSVEQRLLSIMYHNVVNVSDIYNRIFGFKFEEMGQIIKIVSNRHDMVHRNGKNRYGEEIEISNASVLEVIHEVENFISKIDNSITLQ